MTSSRPSWTQESVQYQSGATGETGRGWEYSPLGEHLPSVFEDFDTISDNQTKKVPYKKENSIHEYCTEALACLFGGLKTLSVPSCHFRTLAVTRGFIGPTDEHGTKLYGGSLEEGPEF